MTVHEAAFLAFQVPYNLAFRSKLRWFLWACELDTVVVRYDVFHRVESYSTPLTPSLDGTYVSACSNFRPVHSVVCQFRPMGTILTVFSFSAVRHIRWHTFSTGMALAFVLPNLSDLRTPMICQSWRTQKCWRGSFSIHGYIIPTFGYKVRILLNSLYFTPCSAYNKTCRTPPVSVSNCFSKLAQIDVVSMRSMVVLRIKSRCCFSVFLLNLLK